MNRALRFLIITLALACPVAFVSINSFAQATGGTIDGVIAIDVPGIARVLHAIGPERICGQWWEGHHKTRDYFQVEDENGNRFWIFRVTQTRKWYMHGEFA